MSEKELDGEISYKLAAHKKYGVKFLNIHGISKENVLKIKKIISNYDEREDIDISLEQDKNIILVTITFKER